MKNIVLFSNNRGRGEATLNALLDAGHEVHICTTPLVTEGHIQRLDQYGKTLAIVAGWPYRFTKEELSVPKHGFINCHAGPVPNYRGGSPLNWQIINGEEILRVSLLQMDEGLDTGPILSEQAFRLEKHETIDDAHRRANSAFAEMVVAHVNLLENYPETIRPTSQDFYDSSIRTPKTWPQRTDDMGKIDLSWSAGRIHNFVRALTHPYPGAWLRGSDGKRIRVWNTSLV